MSKRIFISHSQQDADIVEYFKNIFHVPAVEAKPIFEELEKFVGLKNIKSDKIEKDIEDSSAVFVLIGKKIRALPHTKNWVSYEVGVAKALNKPVIVFETFESILSGSDKSMVIPHPDIYIPINLKIKNIDIASYVNRKITELINLIPDISGASPASKMIAGGVGGLVGMYTKDTTGNTTFAIGTAILSALLVEKVLIDQSNNIQIPNNLLKSSLFRCKKCNHEYNLVFLPGVTKIRCPICNSRYIITKRRRTI